MSLDGGPGHATSKIGLLGIMNILSWRGLRKQQKQEVQSDLTPPFSSEIGHKALMGEDSLHMWKNRTFLSQSKGVLQRMRTNRPR